MQILFLCNGFLERLARLEGRKIRSGNDHRLTRLRIAALLLSACTNLKRTKTNDLDLIALCECISNALKHCCYCLIGIFLGNIRFFGDRVNELCIINF